VNARERNQMLALRRQVEVLERRLSTAIDKELLLLNKLIAAEDEIARLRSSTEDQTDVRVS
jgi:hypothetical protein